MASHYISQDTYLKVAQIFNWAKSEDFILWFTGKTDRHRRTEAILPRLVKRGKLRAASYHKRLVYTVPRLAKSPAFDDEYQIEHGLGCTDCLVRFVLSDRNVVIVPERKFRGSQIRPDGGLIYPNGWRLMYEFGTQDNSKRLGVLKNKIDRYLNVMKDNHQIVFVLDLPREKVTEIINKLPAHEAIWYIDYQTFKDIPFGKSLETPVYVNGGNGDILPLRKNGHA